MIDRNLPYRFLRGQPLKRAENERAFFPQGQSKLSVTMRCLYRAGFQTGAGFDCTINKRNLDITKPLYGEHILPVLWVFVQLFVISKFQCKVLCDC